MKRLYRRLRGILLWPSRVALALTIILERLDTMNQQLEALRAELDAATNAIGESVAGVASRMQTLVDQLAANQAPDQAQLDALKADADKLTVSATALKALGSPPAAPADAPTAPPDPAPAG